MSSWIKLDYDLAEKPEAIEIATTLGLDDDQIVGKLHRLWCWVDQRAQGDFVPKATRATVDRIVHCPGFTAALESVGWVSIDPDGAVFHGFATKQGGTQKDRREQWAKSKRKLQPDSNEIPSGIQAERAQPPTGFQAESNEKPTGNEQEESEIPALRVRVREREEEEGKEEKKKPARPRPLDFSSIPIPSNLDSPQTRAALADWLAHKRSRGESYKSADAVLKLLAQFSTPSDFVIAVNHSIACNYAGCFAPKGTGPPRGNSQQRGNQALGWLSEEIEKMGGES